MNFSGKVAIVTGGAHGIGRAAAQALAVRGASVTIVDMDRDAGTRTERMIVQSGGDARFVAADVSRSDEVRAFVDAASSRNGRIDCFFNNAGIEGRIAPIQEADEESFDRVIAVNLKGVFLGLRHVLPIMIRQGGGAVVNTASTAGLRGSANVAPYVASKHGVVGLTRAAAVDVGQYGVRVNAVCPGPVATRMMESIDAQRRALAPAKQAASTATYARVEDIANLVVFLLSDLAGNVHGACYPMDGGRTAQGAGRWCLPPRGRPDDAWEHQPPGGRRDMGRVSGKIALVSGGASGIGAATARLLAQEGAAVVIADLNTEQAETVLESIQNDGGEGLVVKLDAASEESWIDAFGAVRQTYGHLNILVNGAGTQIPRSFPSETTLADWRQLMSVNLDGVFLGTKHGLALMTESQPVNGSIINISSVMGLVALADIGPYNASKGGVRLYTKSVALSCAERDIHVRVNSIHPGFINTPLLQRTMKQRFATEAEGLAVYNALQPVGRLGEPEDIAYGILYLASDEAKFVTGSELVVDGGFTAR